MLSMAGCIWACNCFAVKLTPFWLQGVLTFTKLITGKNIVAPAGTSQERVVDPVPEMPASNHIEPRWPIIHLSPVASESGLTELGIERAHCHHSPVSVGNWPGGKPCAHATLPGRGVKSPRTIAPIAETPLAYFIWSCSFARDRFQGRCPRQSRLHSSPRGARIPVAARPGSSLRAFWARVNRVPRGQEAWNIQHTVRYT